VLELAPAAFVLLVVSAGRIDSRRRRVFHGDELAACKPPTHPHTSADTFTFERARYEHDQPIVPGESVTAGNHALDG
jgi:hypothetical protein